MGVRVPALDTETVCFHPLPLCERKGWESPVPERPPPQTAAIRVDNAGQIQDEAVSYVKAN